MNTISFRLMILLSQYNKCTLCTCVRGVIHFFVKDQNQHQGEKERDQHTHEQHDHNRPAHQGEKRGEKERKTSTPTTNTTTKTITPSERRGEQRDHRDQHTKDQPRECCPFIIFFEIFFFDLHNSPFRSKYFFYFFQ